MAMTKRERELRDLWYMEYERGKKVMRGAIADYHDSKQEYDRMYAEDRTRSRSVLTDAQIDRIIGVPVSETVKQAIRGEQPGTEAPEWRKREMAEMLELADHNRMSSPPLPGTATDTASIYYSMEPSTSTPHPLEILFPATEAAPPLRPVEASMSTADYVPASKTEHKTDGTPCPCDPEYLQVPVYNPYLDCELCGKPGKRGCNGDICGEGGPQDNTPAAEDSILEEAITITSGSRRRDYGHPYDNFRKTGVMWGAQLEAWMTRAKPGDPVPPRLVAAMMVSLKLIRDTRTQKRDNSVDIAGYAYCMDEVDREESRRRLGANVTTDPDLPQ